MAIDIVKLADKSGDIEETMANLQKNIRAVTLKVISNPGLMLRKQKI